jgi:hypothetical protein
MKNNSDQVKSEELKEKRLAAKRGQDPSGTEFPAEPQHQRRTAAARIIKKAENGVFGRKVDIEREQR